MRGRLSYENSEESQRHREICEDTSDIRNGEFLHNSPTAGNTPKETSRPFHTRNRSYDALMLNNFKKNSHRNKATASDQPNVIEETEKATSSKLSVATTGGSSIPQNQGDTKIILQSTHPNNSAEIFDHEADGVQLNANGCHDSRGNGVSNLGSPVYRDHLRQDGNGSGSARSYNHPSNSCLNSPSISCRLQRITPTESHSPINKNDPYHEVPIQIPSYTKSSRSRIKSMNEVDSDFSKFSELLYDNYKIGLGPDATGLPSVENALNTIRTEMRRLVTRSERYLTTIRELQERKNSIERQAGMSIDEIMRSRDILALTMETKSIFGKLEMVRHFLTILNTLKLDLERTKPA